MEGRDSALEGQAVIVISRHNIIKDLLRSYSVFVDRTFVGTLWAFGTGRYAVAPGHHEVCLRVGRQTMAEDPQIELDIASGEVRGFRTGSKRIVFSLSSLLSRAPEWEGGPWITLKPWPALAPPASPGSPPTATPP